MTIPNQKVSNNNNEQESESFVISARNESGLLEKESTPKKVLSNVESAPELSEYQKMIKL